MKTKIIVNYIEGDGDSFAKRAEMFYKRRCELIKLLQELHESYRSLSEKFDLLRTQNTDLIYFRPQPPPPSLSLLDSLSSVGLLHPSHFSENDNSQASGSLQITQTSNYGAQCDPTSEDLKTRPDFLVHENVEENDEVGSINEMELNIYKSAYDFELTNQVYSSDNLWNNLRQNLSRLIEDNVMQQSELARRNDEKREMIKHLRAQVNRLMEENRILKSNVPSYKMDMKRSQSSSSRSSKSRALDCIGKFRD